MKEKQLVFYRDQAGSEPFNDWLNGFQNALMRRRILQRLFRLQSGNYGDYKHLKGGIFELRLHFGSGYRIYFGEDGERIVVLLYGGDKSTQKKDIETAQTYWKEYLSDG